MTSPSPASIQTDGTVASQIAGTPAAATAPVTPAPVQTTSAGKVGGFDTIAPTKVVGTDGNTVKQAATSSAVSINPVNGAVAKASKPIDIPADLKWKEPVTVVQASAKSKGGERALVTYVGDGDGAFLKRADGSKIECRIDSIDAPETDKTRFGNPNKVGQPFGEEAKRTLQGLIENKEVTLRITKPAQPDSPYPKDRRNYCQIEVQGKGVDKSMIEAGAAWLYTRYANDPELVSAEAQAKASRKGLWANLNPEKPEDYRRRVKD